VREAAADYRLMLSEPVPPHATALVNADGWIAGFEWSTAPPQAIPVVIRRRPPGEAKARLLAAGMPEDLAEELSRG
jgi:hypothetical protein